VNFDCIPGLQRTYSIVVKYLVKSAHKELLSNNTVQSTSGKY